MKLIALGQSRSRRSECSPPAVAQLASRPRPRRRRPRRRIEPCRSRSPTRAATRLGRDDLRAVTFKVENTGAAGVTELEVIKDKRILGEVENLAAGLNGGLLAHAPARDVRALLPERDDAGARHAHRQRRPVATRRQRSRSQGDRGYARTSIGAGGAARRADEGVHRRDPGRQRREGEEALPDRPRAVRADRAGRRVVRRPRPADRRARRRRPRGDVDGLPPAREDALGRAGRPRRR